MGEACSNNAERAADWLFSHADTLDADVAALESKAEAPSGGGASEDRPAIAAVLLTPPVIIIPLIPRSD